MADNTNAQAVNVSNAKVRPLADRLCQAYNLLKGIQAEFTAQNWAVLFPTADPTGEVIDGARVDGRTIITNADVNNVFSVATAYIQFLEATSNQKLNQVLKVAVNADKF